MIRSGKIFPLVLVAAAVAFIAFGLLSVLGGGNTVSGKVVSVDSASVTTISSLTIEDDTGEQWTFRGAGTFSGFTPSHLEEHRALQESVTVEYEELDSGELSIVGLSD
ncbi:MAG: hypothetical protein HOJ22_03390 [Chloroflexi bacterium]|jgi:hypothetical protein|nr:hypothetical protein [Chloroflexota bacterium]MBT5627312.1 hypothetical protein [Chloroflexota bacterium]